MANRKNEYYKFVLNSIIFIFVVFALDIGIGKTLEYYYFKQESGVLYRTTYSMEKTDADLLVFGSSRANHHYYPDTFENKLNLKYYNVGRDGNFIFYHYAVLRTVLKRYVPKFVILDFKEREFAKEADSYERLSSLLPYYKTHAEIRNIVEFKGPFEKFKMISCIYPFNSSILTIFVGNSEFNKKRKSDRKGYVPLGRVMESVVKIEPYKYYEIDSNKLNAYTSFISECTRANIKIIVVCSPKYNSGQMDSSVILGQQLARKYNINFYDYSNDTIFNNKKIYFADPEHLNVEGSKKFSSELCVKINKNKSK